MISLAPRTPASLALLLLASACGGQDLPGHYFEISLAGADNQCTGNGANYSETYEYRMELVGNDVTMFIGEDLWATGSLEGCDVVYDSLAWSSYREDFEIEWRIDGAARADIGGGDGCVTEGDWEGTETFLVTGSAHPDVSPGCTYTLDVTGKYLREVL